MINATITLTKNYTLNFSKEVRREIKNMGFNTGQKFVLIKYKSSIRLIPIVDDIRQLRGTLIGIDTIIEREEEDRV